jgi:hypothetical protein
MLCLLFEKNFLSGLNWTKNFSKCEESVVPCGLASFAGKKELGNANGELVIYTIKELANKKILQKLIE